MINNGDIMVYKVGDVYHLVRITKTSTIFLGEILCIYDTKYKRPICTHEIGGVIQLTCNDLSSIKELPSSIFSLLLETKLLYP